MKPNRTVQRIFSILLLAGLVLSMAQPVTVTARTVEPQAPGVTVEPQALEQMAAHGAASYWIDLFSKAGLSRAQGMDWSKRGKTVSVIADTVARQDSVLNAGHLGFDPTSFEKTMTIGDAPASESLTISNDGDAPAAVSIFEIERGYEPPTTRVDPARRVTLGGAPPELTASGATEGKAGGAPVSAFPNADVSLTLDDGSAENGIGIVGGNREFIFLNRFTPSTGSYPFTLKEIQVYFRSDDYVKVGDDMVLVVYENTSGNADPAVGANLRASFPVTVQAVDSWNTYTLPAGVFLSGPGDVLIGVIALETPGSDYYPAAIDTTASQRRSWAGIWASSPPPDPPSLPPGDTWMLIDDAGFAGNWLIRGAGVTAPEDVIWLSLSPITTTIPGGSSQAFTVTFDPSSLSQPGDYKAELYIQHDTPGAYPNIPVTLHLLKKFFLYLPTMGVTR